MILRKKYDFLCKLMANLRHTLFGDKLDNSPKTQHTCLNGKYMCTYIYKIYIQYILMQNNNL